MIYSRRNTKRLTRNVKDELEARTMPDPKLELIGKQQLEIARLKERLICSQKALRKIKMEIICIGGPLNDNALQYNKQQLVPFQLILNAAEGAIEND